MSISRENEAVARLIDECMLHSDDTLIVHSAFAGLSRADYRAETVIEALLDALPNLTLLMPTMTWRTVTPENPNFDEMATPSHTGALTEVFRTRYASHRSIHPTHSTAALGPKADYMTRWHHLGETPCPPHSPFGRLAAVDAGILLLGVGFESCTAIHCWEEQINPDYYVKPRTEAAIYHCRDRNGIIHDVLARRHYRLNRNFNKFAPMLAEYENLGEGRIGPTEWLFCRSRALGDCVLASLAKNPKATTD